MEWGKNSFFLYHLLSEDITKYLLLFKKLDIMNDSKKENQGFKLINWKLIAIGCIIFFICWIIAFGLTFSVPFFLLFPSLVKLYPILLNIALVILFLSPLIAGFTVAYINNIPEYKSGIINGVIGIITVLSYLIYLAN